MTASRPGRVLVLLAVLVLPGRVLAGEPKEEPSTSGRPDVTVVRDITYYSVPDDPDPYRHKLDVYRPKGKGPFPVLVLLHGGAWVAMSKDDVLGLHGYGTIARDLAQRGLVVVLPNYRLSPAVKHPEHIKDVARAFAWTCKNVAKHGGDPKQIFVGGHSAGGHLATLLATDESYLRKEGRSRKDIRGVIGISGVYRVEDLDLKLSAIAAAGSLRLDLAARPFSIVFGKDPKVVRQASPLNHVQPGLPPFLLLNAGWDYPPLPPMAKDFAAALKKNGVLVETKVLPWRTHETLLFDIPRLRADRGAVKAVVDFIDRHKDDPCPCPGKPEAPAREPRKAATKE